MSIGGKKDDYDFSKEEDDLEWWAEQRMNIREVRMVYSSLTHYSNIWEKWNGDRPPEEIEFLNWYKGKLFSMKPKPRLLKCLYIIPEFIKCEFNLSVI